MPGLPGARVLDSARYRRVGGIVRSSAGAAHQGQRRENRFEKGRLLPFTDRDPSNLTHGILLFILAMGAWLVAAAPASANEPFKIEFDKSNIQLGALGGVGNLPLDSLASGATLEGTIDGAGNVTIPKGNFQMPELGLQEPIRVRGFMGIESPATGTYDRATGQLELDAKAGIWLAVDVAALLDLAGLDIGDLIGGIGGTGGINIGPLITPLLNNLTCGFSPMDVHFTTESNSLASGSRFVNGPTGAGAITAEWSQLGPFAGRTKLLGLIDPCLLIMDFLPDLLEGGIPGGIDLGGIDLPGILANLDDLDLGPSAITLTRSLNEPPIVDPPIIDPPIDPVDPPAGRARLQLSVTPKQRRVRAGRPTVFRVKVRNTGNAAAKRVRVCLRGPGVGLLVRWHCRRFGQIKARSAKVQRIRVRVRRNAPRRAGRFRFQLRSSNAPNRNSAARLLIRRR